LCSRLKVDAVIKRYEIKKLSRRISKGHHTNQVAGSIPDGVMEFFINVNPSDRTMALGSTQHLTNDYQDYFLGVNAAGA
jgi:hypothetical protein